MTDTIHLHPTAALADRALLPGDPGRALALAQTLLTEPRMFNHHRGLWGYTGAAADGRPLTIQSTGMGGPSAAIVLEELLTLGLRRAIRVGTCGAVAPGLALGELVLVAEAIAADGTSRALGAGDRVPADAQLLGALRHASRPAGHDTAPRTHVGAVVSSDLFYDPRPGTNARWHEQGALAVEMEAATLLALGQRHGAAVACVLVVSDLLGDRRERISEPALAAAAQSMGAIAAAALGGD